MGFIYCLNSFKITCVKDKPKIIDLSQKMSKVSASKKRMQKYKIKYEVRGSGKMKTALEPQKQ